MNKDLTESFRVAKEIQRRLIIRMGGMPFSEMDSKTRKIRRGYVFEGKKYYCGESK